ncbi:MAG: hypothetical protein MRJ65_15680 [Candidatus Brocadiaceae bacterium]|nr:hypothetical protein [Candidatus Brocadiaceae bacterium]
MKYYQYLFAFFLLFSISGKSFAMGKIVDYFLKDPAAWEDTMRITHSKPLKIIVEDGIQGLGFYLEELTAGDEVALVFLETQQAEMMKKRGFCDASAKLVPGKNRIVAVITKNSGSRTQFHYKFLFQRNINSVPVSIYNNGNAVLESEYDGSRKTRDVSNLSGIKLCEVEIR